MTKAKAKKHYRYIKRGEVIPRDAEIREGRKWNRREPDEVPGM